METAAIVLGFLLQAGAFMGLGAMLCRWADERRAERAERARQERMSADERELRNRPPLWQPAPPPDIGDLARKGWSG